MARAPLWQTAHTDVNGVPVQYVRGLLRSRTTQPAPNASVSQRLRSLGARALNRGAQAVASRVAPDASDEELAAIGGEINPERTIIEFPYNGRSSFIDSLTYDLVQQVLWVHIYKDAPGQNVRSYFYPETPYDQAIAMAHAYSEGRFYNAEVKLGGDKHVPLSVNAMMRRAGREGRMSRRVATGTARRLAAATGLRANVGPRREYGP